MTSRSDFLSKKTTFQGIICSYPFHHHHSNITGKSVLLVSALKTWHLFTVTTVSIYTLLIVWHDGPWNLCRTHILLFFLLYLTLFFWNFPKFSPYFFAPFLVSFFFLFLSEFPLLLALTLFFQFCCCKPPYVNRLYKKGFCWNSWCFFPFYVDIRKDKTFHKACWYSTG